MCDVVEWRVGFFFFFCKKWIAMSFMIKRCCQLDFFLFLVFFFFFLFPLQTIFFSLLFVFIFQSLSLDDSPSSIR